MIPKIGLYRNISLLFIIFTVILIVAVFLLLYNQATIIVKAEAQDINLSFNTEVKENPEEIELKEKNVISGELVSHEKSKKGEFEVLSTKSISSELVGKIKIVNKANHNQVLVKTTQLQADNGVIVRTNEQVLVPAKGEIMVDVYPKDPDNFSEIKPGNLVIIKLGQSLQDKVYGVAVKALIDEPQEIKVLAESDINRAQNELSAAIVREIKQEFGLDDKDGLTTKIVEMKTDKEIGDEADSFNLDLTLQVGFLEINNDQLHNLLERKINALDLVGFNFTAINMDNVSFSIIDDDFGDAVLINVDYQLSFKINSDHDILKAGNFIGKDILKIKEILKQSDLINEVDVYSSPYWKDKMPKQSDHIRIIVN